MTQRAKARVVAGLFGALLGTSLLLALFAPMDRAKLFKDRVDVPAYIERTDWVDRVGSRPYRDVFQEYPPLGAYYLALPRAVGGATVERYEVPFYILGALCLAAMFALCWRSLRAASPWRLLLLASPCVVYFAMSRYDALPALLVLAMIVAHISGREVWSAVFFGLACGVKWYPVALVPLFFVLSRRKLLWLGVAGTVALIACFHPLLYAPWKSLWQSYKFHLDRGSNPGSTLMTAQELWPWLRAHEGSLKHFWLALQLAPAVAAAFIAWRRRVDPRDTASVGALAFAAVAGFVVFAKFQSPQWTVWLAPLAVLANVRGVAIHFLAADLIKYGAYPIVANTRGEISHAMFVCSALWTLMMLYAIHRALAGAGKAPFVPEALPAAPAAARAAS